MFNTGLSVQDRTAMTRAVYDELIQSAMTMLTKLDLTSNKEDKPDDVSIVHYTFYIIIVIILIISKDIEIFKCIWTRIMICRFSYRLYRGDTETGQVL